MKVHFSKLVHFINPEKVIEELGVKKNFVVADFGCGSGYFSIPLARKVGKEGVVYSLDVLPEAMEAVISKAGLAKLRNIITRRVNLEKERGSGLKTGSVDVVVIKDVLFQNKNKEMILKEARRILKPDGKALVVEWDDRDFTIGPDKSLRVARKKLEELIRKERFKIERKIDVGSFHYAFVIVK